MLLFTTLLALVSCAFSSSLDELARRRTFSLNQVAVNRSARHPVEAIRETYWKYGIPVPPEVDVVVERVVDAVDRWAPPGQATVNASSVKNDLEYLIDVKVGKHDLMLDLDTGSSDLWVMSTLLEAGQRAGKPVTRLYDPVNAQEMSGSKWQVRYGDRSSAGGKVYLDRVSIGDVAFQKQAVQAATKMSSSFSKGGSMDGLLGLGNGKLNTIKPKAQPTWFENIRGQLASPVFTCLLKRRATGSFDFGFIDKKKYKGEITWSTVKGQKGFWDLQTSGFSIDNGPTVASSAQGIVDTGSSLWFGPPDMVNAYWEKVNGATFNQIQGGFVFPCTSKLPDLHVVISGKKISVAGPNMNYQSVGRSACFGGLQRNTGMPFSIFGDVFLKGVFVVFEHVPGNPQRMGFAQQADEAHKSIVS